MCTTGHFCDQFSGSVTLTTGTGITAAAGIIVGVTFPINRSTIPNCSYSVENNTVGTQFVATVLNANSNNISWSSSTLLTASQSLMFLYVCGGA